MDLALLRTFAGVIRAGSFAAYAREIGVDPSSVSRSIAALEAELDVRLFERTTRRLAPTEAGTIYLDKIGPVLDALSEAADAARDVLSEPRGLLKVAASVAFGERWLLPRVASFRSSFPKIHLDLQLSDANVDLAAEGVDLALRHGPRVEGALVVAKLFDTRYRVVAAPDYLARRGRPQRPAEIAAHEAIGFSLPGHGPEWRMRRRVGGETQAIAPQMSLTVSNALAVRRAALDGMGLALMAQWTVAEDLEAGALIDLFPEFDVRATDFEAAAWIAYRDRSYMPTRLRLLIDHLKRSVAQGAC